ncbi:MAG TPA: 3-oxoacyl-[acyl-carrier-protein] reductase [Verrucomicrobiae bacterium]|nr:3-oxoacyl-[acyl-carrier-protein] reductase [Verrucomicrobiae bacterium]
MEKLLENKVAVVTGAGRGIGKAIALRLAGEGATIAACGRTMANVESTAGEIVKAGGKATAYAVDVANSAQVTETCEKILKEFGRVDVLVNNAGITRDQLLLRMTDAEWDTVLDTNLKGAFCFTRSISRAMLKQRSGRIINITSIIGLTGNAGQSNYAASKAGLIGFTKSVARELASRGITANAVAPGFIVTEMTDGLGEPAREVLKTRIALGRLGTAEDVAHVVLFLASDLAAYVTGQVITVDGGLAM